MGMENRHCKISHRKPDIKGKQELIQWRTDVRYCTSPKASHIHTDSGNTVNEARALRVTELMRDYQSIHQTISNIQANPRPDDYHEIGYATLRQCHTEARALLNAGFSAELLQPSTNGDNAAKRQLQWCAHSSFHHCWIVAKSLHSVILDACARRLKAQKIYLGAAAAVKWINSRNAVLQGQKPQSGHVSKLQQVDNALRNVSLPHHPLPSCKGFHTCRFSTRSLRMGLIWGRISPTSPTSESSTLSASRTSRLVTGLVMIRVCLLCRALLDRVIDCICEECCLWLATVSVCYTIIALDPSLLLHSLSFHLLYLV